MNYDQLPLPIDARMFREEWEALGHALLHCPGCKMRVSYPANTSIYAVVCKCGWFTEVDEENRIWWWPPSAAEGLIQKRFFDVNAQN